MLELSDKMKEFVAEVFPVIVGTKRSDGTVQMNPAWFEFRDGCFWLNGSRGRRWLHHIEHDKEVTLAFLDPKDMLRYAQVQGRLVITTEQGAAEHIDRLSYRYRGQAYQWRGGRDQQRVIIQIEPVRVTGSAS